MRKFLWTAMVCLGVVQASSQVSIGKVISLAQKHMASIDQGRCEVFERMKYLLYTDTASTHYYYDYDFRSGTQVIQTYEGMDHQFLVLDKTAYVVNPRISSYSKYSQNLSYAFSSQPFWHGSAFFMNFVERLLDSDCRRQIALTDSIYQISFIEDDDSSTLWISVRNFEVLRYEDIMYDDLTKDHQYQNFEYHYFPLKAPVDAAAAIAAMQRDYHFESPEEATQFDKVRDSTMRSKVGTMIDLVQLSKQAGRPLNPDDKPFILFDMFIHTCQPCLLMGRDLTGWINDPSFSQYFQVWGVDEEPGDVPRMADFLQRTGLGYKVISGEQASLVYKAVSPSTNGYAWPSQLILSRQGKVLAYLEGYDENRRVELMKLIKH